MTEKRDVDKMCGYTIWPYTENNFCVDEKGHEMPHTDAKGRKFDNFELIKEKDQS